MGLIIFGLFNPRCISRHILTRGAPTSPSRPRRLLTLQLSTGSLVIIHHRKPLGQGRLLASGGHERVNALS